jgi:hypothetical protein
MAGVSVAAPILAAEAAGRRKWSSVLLIRIRRADGSQWAFHPGAPPVKPPPTKTRLKDLKGGSGPVGKFEPPTPKVSRQKKGKTLTPAEKAAFLAGRPDLKR